MELDDNFKRLIKELGQAINESLADSDTISEVMGRIRSAGYDLFLVLEVTIGFNKQGEQGTIHHQKISTDDDSVDPALELTPQDAQFLRSLKIIVENDTQ